MLAGRRDSQRAQDAGSTVAIRQGTPDSFIEVEGLSYWYRDRENRALKVPAIEGASLSIGKGEFACILGPSGCGKSTLLTVLSGLSSPQEGSVSVNGQVIYRDGNRVAQRMPRCGYVFQDARLLPWRTVRQNITLALKGAGIPQEKWDGIVLSSLRMLRLEDYAEAWPLKLSGGQRHRAAIARALAVQPQFVLMDEPFSTLDEVTARFLRKELLEVWERTGKTIVFVTHSIREAVYLADDIFLMSKGPGRVFEKLTIDVPRPRLYEDPKLTEIEASVVDTVLAEWGYFEPEEEGASTVPAGPAEG
jgi:NitT/TauT family transport system ATP-binding protein